MKRGDWVVFDPQRRRQIGRVASVGDKVAFVCYSHGCTAASSPLDLLVPYDPDLFPDLAPDARIGFHRFDDYCPSYDPTFCPQCRGKRHE